MNNLLTKHSVACSYELLSEGKIKKNPSILEDYGIWAIVEILCEDGEGGNFIEENNLIQEHMIFEHENIQFRCLYLYDENGYKHESEFKFNNEYIFMKFFCFTTDNHLLLYCTDISENDFILQLYLGHTESFSDEKPYESLSVWLSSFGEDDEDDPQD